MATTLRFRHIWCWIICEFRSKVDDTRCKTQRSGEADDGEGDSHTHSEYIYIYIYIYIHTQKRARALTTSIWDFPTTLNPELKNESCKWFSCVSAVGRKWRVRERRGAILFFKKKANMITGFYVLLTVHPGIILVNNQLDAQFFMYVYYFSLHVLGSHVPIIRRIIVWIRHPVYVTMIQVNSLKNCASIWSFTRIIRGRD